MRNITNENKIILMRICISNCIIIFNCSITNNLNQYNRQKKYGY